MKKSCSVVQPSGGLGLPPTASVGSGARRRDRETGGEGNEEKRAARPPPSPCPVPSFAPPSSRIGHAVKTARRGATYPDTHASASERSRGAVSREFTAGNARRPRQEVLARPRKDISELLSIAPPSDSVLGITLASSPSSRASSESRRRWRVGKFSAAGKKEGREGGGERDFWKGEGREEEDWACKHDADTAAKERAVGGPVRSVHVATCARRRALISTLHANE